MNLSDETGAVQVSYKLDPYGQIREQTGNTVNRQVFTGHQHDENTGLVYMKARYYDPDTGRFITQDSYLGESTTPPSLHRYMYAYSNPLAYIDLNGYKTIESFINFLTKFSEATEEQYQYDLALAQKAKSSTICGSVKDLGYSKQYNTTPQRAQSALKRDAYISKGMNSFANALLDTSKIADYVLDYLHLELSKNDENLADIHASFQESVDDYNKAIKAGVKSLTYENIKGTVKHELQGIEENWKNRRTNVKADIETKSTAIKIISAIYGAAKTAASVPGLVKNLKNKLDDVGSVGFDISTPKKTDIPEKLYRKANPNRDADLTPREIDEGLLSAESVLANPIEFKSNPLFPPKKQWIEIDTKLLPEQGKELIPFGDRPTHWGIPENVTSDDIRKAITSKSSGKGNPPNSWR